jgi:hypothetical protein
MFHIPAIVYKNSAGKFSILVTEGSTKTLTTKQRERLHISQTFLLYSPVVLLKICRFSVTGKFKAKRYLFLNYYFITFLCI